MSELFVMSCHHCGYTIGRILEGSIEIKCPQCDTALYIKCNKRALTIKASEKMLDYSKDVK